MKVTELDKEIKNKIIEDRQKEYGDYQYNFAMLAEMFTIILAKNLKKTIEPHQVGHIMMALKLYRATRIYNDMAFQVHKKDIDKKDKL
jgi:hypothetical protein